MSVLVALMDVIISVTTLLVDISAPVILDMPQHQITSIAWVSSYIMYVHTYVEECSYVHR